MESNSVRIASVSAYAPSCTEENSMLYNSYGGGNDSFLSTTSFEQHRKAAPEIYPSDLCLVATEKLIPVLKWGKSSIDAIVYSIFVSDLIEV